MFPSNVIPILFLPGLSKQGDRLAGLICQHISAH